MKILAVSFFQDLWVMSLPEALGLSSLQVRGHEIERIVCDSIFSDFCTVMNARGMKTSSNKASRDRVCQSCTKTRDLLSNSFGFNDRYLSSFVSQNELEVIKTKSESLSLTELLKYGEDSYPIGSYSLYQCISRYKLMSTDFSPDQLRSFRVEFFNCLVSYRAAKKYFENNSPDRVIIYSPQYTYNRPWAEVARAKNIPSYRIEGGTNTNERLRSLRAASWDKYEIKTPSLEYYPKYSDEDFLLEEFELVADYLWALLNSIDYAVYSTKKTGVLGLRENFRFKKDSKVILACLSSYDESYAAYLAGLFPKEKTFSQVFETQIDWLRALIDYVSERSDLSLLVRVHPRDFKPNAYVDHSEHGHLLRALLQELPSNIQVNWPEQKLSLYDLAEDVDIVTTGWSTAAVELSLLGLPAVVYDASLPSYPLDLVWSGVTSQEYFANIEKAIQSSWSSEIAKKTLRWLAVDFSKNVVRLPNSLDKVGRVKPSLITRLFRGVSQRLTGHEVSARALELLRARTKQDELSRFVSLIESGKKSLHDFPVQESRWQRDMPAHERLDIGLRMVFEVFLTKSKPGSKLSKNISSFLDLHSKQSETLHVEKERGLL